MSLEPVTKFDQHVKTTLFESLLESEKISVKNLAVQHQFSYQELKLFIEKTIDLRMWGESSAKQLWQKFSLQKQNVKGRDHKKQVFQLFNTHYESLKDNSFSFRQKPELSSEYKITKQELRKEGNQQEVFGMCAVQSEKTSCCNLRTIDAVKNCGFGCSYCSIQTMYGDETVVFDENLQVKLDGIQLDKNKLYHIGTGQASDSLMWGNQHGVLDSMLGFAKKWPNALLEFKTKSKNIKYLLKEQRPKNIVCSWSVNPQDIIENEEHLTASFADRVKAARACADHGIKVGFHLHPMIYYRDWQEGYQHVIQTLVDQFKPEEVLFVSFGSLTFSKPVIKKIRQYNIQSKMLQMPMVSNPEGKQTYPFEVKKQMFKFAYDQFQCWHDKVYFFLCMEEKRLWQTTFGWEYANNEMFEQDLVTKAFAKINQ